MHAPSAAKRQMRGHHLAALAHGDGTQGIRMAVFADETEFGA